MGSKAAITVNRPREELERLWSSSEHRPQHIADADAAVTFRDAPGDRGTEIHVDLGSESSTGRLGGIVRRLTEAESLARVKDDLRRFKQHVETGEVPRSDGTPEGERVDRKLKQRPAQPLTDEERQEVLA